MNNTQSSKKFHRVIDTQIEINAEPELVWQVLTDVESWEKWNDFIPKVAGNLQAGERINIKVVLPDAKPMIFKPKVYEVISNEKIRWGSSVLKIFFRGEHEFLVKPTANGKTLFRQIERFSGLLVIFMNSTLRKTEQGHHKMNSALKKHIENK